MENQTNELQEFINKAIKNSLTSTTLLLENLAKEFREMGYQEEADSVRQAASHMAKASARLEFRFKEEAQKG